MSGDTHAAVGVATALTGCALFPYLASGGVLTVATGTLVCIAGAWFPDLDLGRSKGSKAMNKLLTILIPMLVLVLGGQSVGLWKLEQFGVRGTSLLFFCILLLIGVWSRTRPHREFTHSFLALVGTTLLVGLIFGKELWVWYGIGYLSHLLIDLLNGKGEALLWPMGERFCFKMCSASGVVNQILKYVAMAVIALALARMKVGGAL